MAGLLTFAVDPRQLLDRLTVAGEVAQGAQLAALERTGKRARTRIVRELAAVKGVQQKLVRQRTGVFIGNRRSVVPYVRVWIGTKKPIRFNQAPTAIRKIRPPSSFKATMRSGHIGYFTRRKRSRLPIDEVEISLLPEAEDILTEKVEEQLRDYFPREFRRDYTRRLRQKGWR